MAVSPRCQRQVALKTHSLTSREGNLTDPVSIGKRGLQDRLWDILVKDEVLGRLAGLGMP